MGTLPVLHLARTAWMTVFYNLPWVWKLGRIPLLLGLAAALVGVGAPFAPDGAPRLALAILRGVLLVAAFLAWAPLVGRWLRFTLWVVEGKLPDLTLRWQQPEWLTLAWMAGFAVASAVFLLVASVAARTVTAGPGLVTLALVALFCLLWLGLVLRFALVLPAAALGEQMDPGRSWNRTSPAPLSFLAAVVLAILPVLALEGVLGAARMLLPVPALSMVTALLHPLVGFVGGVVFLAVVALAYRMLISFSVGAWEAGVMGDPAATAPEPEPVPPAPEPGPPDAGASDSSVTQVVADPPEPEAGPESPEPPAPADDGRTRVVAAPDIAAPDDAAPEPEPEPPSPEPAPAPDPEPWPHDPGVADSSATRVVAEPPVPEAIPEPPADDDRTQVITEPPEPEAGPESPEPPAPEAVPEPPADDDRTRVITEPPAMPPVPEPAPESPTPEAEPAPEPEQPEDDGRTRVISEPPARNTGEGDKG